MEQNENLTADAPVEEAVLSPKTDETPDPVAEVPAEDAPTEDAPTEEFPAEDAPAEDAPTEEVPTEDAPTEEVPAEDAPAEDAPAEDAPTEEVPTEEVPAEDAPTEDAPTEDAPKKGKGKKSKSKMKFKLPSLKKGGIGMIVYAALLVACIVFLAVSGIFTGIGETFVLVGNAREEISDLMDALRDAGGTLTGGSLGGGSLGGEHDPDKIYDVNVLLSDTFDARKETVDVAHLNLTSSELRAAVERFLFTNPCYFYVSTSYKVVYRQNSDVVMSVAFTYLYDEATTAEMRAELDAAVQEIVDGAPEFGTAFDDVLYFHDYLVKHYAYDYRDLPENERIRDAYHFFAEGKGVCQAYMQAMTLLCHARGIESIPVVSEELDHAWNLVKVDGSWYHVDVTWDDAGGETAPVYPSYNSYRYFMLSDAAIKEAGHATYRTWEKATDTRYDNAVWRESQTAMVRLGDKYYVSYYKKDGTLGDPDDPHGTEILCGTPENMTLLRDLGGICWYESGDTCYQSAFMSLVVKGNYVYFNTSTSVYRYDPATDTMLLLADLTPMLAGKQIFGIAALDGNTLSLVTAIRPKGAYTILDYTLPQ